MMNLGGMHIKGEELRMSDKTFRYKGYYGSIEFSITDYCLFGRIKSISDTILYGAETLAELEAAFREAVDHYLDDGTGDRLNWE